MVVKQFQDGGRTAVILKIYIFPYLSEKSSDFHEILYTASDFELDERHVIKNEKVALDRLCVRQNILLVETRSHKETWQTIRVANVFTRWQHSLICGVFDYVYHSVTLVEADVPSNKCISLAKVIEYLLHRPVSIPCHLVD